MKVRNFRQQDIEDVLRIQTMSYDPILHEPIATFEKYARDCPQGCFVVLFESEIVGYVFSFPYYRDRSISSSVPSGSRNCFYLHDMASNPLFRGKGISGLLLSEVERVARELKYAVLTLTSVNNQRSFWEHRGFKYIKKIQIFDKAEADLMEKHLVDHFGEEMKSKL